MPDVTIQIPAPLRPLAGDREQVRLEAGTAAEAIEALTRDRPRLRARLYREDGRLRPNVNVFVDGRDLRDVDGDEALEGETRITIVPSIAGGRPRGSGGHSPASTAAEAVEGPGHRGRGPDLTRDDLRRYGRHLVLPEVGREGQERLKGASVLVVGAGGLGSPAAMYLAAAGIGRLGLVDHDAVDYSNLQRQLLHDTDDVGRPKLVSARERLEALNPGVRVETHETRLDASNAMEILAGYDVVVDGSDNFPTRYLVNDAAVLSGLPLVYGAIFRFEGQAAVFGAPDGPCYRCLFPEPPPPGAVPSCAEAGVLGVLPGIVGAVQATEAIKLALGRGRTLAGRLLLVDALEMSFRELEVRPDPGCPACGEDPEITELIDYEAFCGMPADEDRDRSDGVPAVDVDELERRLARGEELQLLDVREPYEWEICNLGDRGARLVPLGQLPGRFHELDPDAPTVVYCRSGGRSATAVELLRRAGFEDAVNLEGGILAWAHRVDPDMPTY